MVVLWRRHWARGLQCSGENGLWCDASVDGGDAEGKQCGSSRADLALGQQPGGLAAMSGMHQARLRSVGGSRLIRYYGDNCESGESPPRACQSLSWASDGAFFGRRQSQLAWRSGRGTCSFIIRSASVASLPYLSISPAHL